MEETLKVLNQLERDGVIGRYAIGGAMGATFYVEPMLTYDLDVFMVMPPNSGVLVSLAPLFAKLKDLGFVEKGECVNIKGVPVQFLPAHNELLIEALTDARTTRYGNIETRVLRGEHLVAICLQTGREKDRQRVRTFNEQANLDQGFLAEVLTRHHLEAKWKQWTN